MRAAPYDRRRRPIDGGYARPADAPSRQAGTDALERTRARRPNPLIYEIDTWPWLERLGRAAGGPVHLATVPRRRVGRPGRAGRGRRLADGRLATQPGRDGDRDGRPGQHGGLPAGPARPRGPGDVVGSPYCVRDYVVDDRLGGPAGLAAARRALARPGDGSHPRLRPQPRRARPPVDRLEHPDFFVGGTDDDLERDPRSFVRAGERILACGRDPYFPAWSDVVQLDAFSPGLREAAAATLAGILDQCDGVRCDMAMLMLNEVFARTWGERVGPAPATEYWTDVIGAVRADPSRGGPRRGGLLGPRVAAPAARLRLRLRQTALRPPRPRRRRVRAPPPLRGPRLPGGPRALHREPRRAARRVHVRRRAASGGGGRGADPARRAPGARRAARGPPRPPAGVPRPVPRRAAGPGPRALVPGPPRRAAAAGPAVRAVGAVRAIGLARQRPLAAARGLVLGGRRRPGSVGAGRGRPLAHRRQPRPRRRRRAT